MSFNDLPIRRKVQLLVLITSGCVLLLTCTTFVTYDLVTLRSDIAREITTMAEVLAATSSGAVAFDNPEEAIEGLAALDKVPGVVAAALYDKQGALFARYATANAPPVQLLDQPARTEFHRGRIVVVQPVVEADRRVGMLYFETDLKRWSERMWFYGVVVSSVFGVAFVITLIVSAVFRRGITRPIEELGSIARAVSQAGDYTVRAQRFGGDELGELTDAFNQMLGHVYDRDEKLRESEERLRLALSAADMGIWRYDPRRNHSARDGSLSRLLGLAAISAGESLEAYIERVHPDDRRFVQASVEHAVRHRSDLQMEYRIRRPDDAVRWIRTHGRVLTDPGGGVICLTGASFDITDRKASEEEVRRLNADLERRVVERTAELELANRDLESFTYSVSHDLRSPLRTLSGFAELLLVDFRETLPPEARSHAERLVRGAERMGRLIDDLLNFSRLGRLPLAVQHMEFDRLVDDVIADLESETAGRRIEWRRTPLPHVPCDPGLLRQVFDNLISNAVKYSRPRDPAVIEIGVSSQNGETYVFVRDNGVGFDMRDYGKLFRVFERLHRPTEFEGTGVGLAIVARIVRKHGGKVHAEGRVDEGATFYFHLPGMPNSVPESRTSKV